MQVSFPRVTLLCALLAACATPEAFREGVRVSDRLYPGAVTEAEGAVVTRLVDDLTGQPLAGAEVFLVEEHNAPIAGEFWFTSRFVSDSEGFVHLEGPPGGNSLGGWIVVRHPSCGVATRYHSELVCRLGRGFDVPVRITDWLGQPQPGARIGFCGGCGHTPDLVNATADQNGIAILRGIDPKNNGGTDLYVQHPGLEFFYDDVQWWPGQPPMEVRCSPAPPLTGRLIDHGGQPVAGACVCGGDKHRGPWARTAADGSFAILGAEPPTYPYLVVLPGGRKVDFEASRSWPVTLRLPDLADAGAHEGTVEDEPPPPPTLETREVRVMVEGAPAKLHLGRFAPRLDGSEVQEGEPMRVPAHGPFVLVAWDGADEHAPGRRYVFADGAAVPDPMVVKWIAAPRVTGRLVGPDGRAVAARVRFRNDEQGHENAWRNCDGGMFTLDAPRSGRQLVEIAPADPSLRARLVPVTVPEPVAPATLDLGELRLQNGAQLRVLDAAGSQLRGATAAFGRAGWQHGRESGYVREWGDHWRQWPLDEDGAFCGPDLRTGDSLLVERDGHVPFRTVLQGDGPWTLTAPAGQLDLAVVDAGGSPLGATLVVADEDVEVKAGNAHLRGLPPGPTRIWVSAPGHRSAVVDAMITSAPKSVQVVLPRR